MRYKDRSHANRGQSLEHFMRFANEQYMRSGVAIVTKQATEFLPIRNAYGQVVNCKVVGKATVDFMGRVGNRPLAIEAKETKGDSIRFDRVEDHQAEFLDRFTAHQLGLGLVVVSFNLDSFYAVPWECWKAGRDAWKAAQRAGKRKADQIDLSYHGRPWRTPGKASVREDELLQEWQVPVGGIIGLDYLKNYR